MTTRQQKHDAIDDIASMLALECDRRQLAALPAEVVIELRDKLAAALADHSAIIAYGVTGGQP